MSCFKFVVDKNIPLVGQAFGTLGSVTLLETGEFTPERMRDADALIVRSETKIDRKLLEGSRVQFVGTATIGTDHVDVDYLMSRGIAFASAPGCNSNSVKEYVVAALLYLAAEKRFSLAGKTLGVVGVGNVGSKVVQAAGALGLTVLQNDPPLARQTGDPCFVPLSTLMNADIISLHVPLTKSGSDPTFHLFDRFLFEQLKPGMVFMNTSRGAVVDSYALKHAIAVNRLGWTVLDVWENEPQIDAGLLPNTTLGTPHIAGYSLEGKLNAVRIIREAICRHFRLISPWEPPASACKASLPDIVIPEEDASSMQMLHRVVRHAYDIASDDRLLRAETTMPVEQRSEHFRLLRAHYRVRHEFSAMTVHLPMRYSGMEETLRSLGFFSEISSRHYAHASGT